MHCLTQACSLLEREDPGLGTQASKQFSLMFYMTLVDIAQSIIPRKSSYLDNSPRVGGLGLDENLSDDALLDRIGVHGWYWLWGFQLT